MEAISQSLQPYKNVVGQVASIVTILQFFSGGFVCRDIYKKGNTEGIASTPFIGGVVVGILMLKHGLLLQDAAMIQVNVVAIILNTIYVAFYYKFATDKYKDVLQPLAVGTAIVAVLLGYAAIESPEELEFRFGLILTILLLLLLGAPLKDVKDIIEKKDASSIPLPITLMGAIVTFLWLVYGIILMNGFMIVANIYMLKHYLRKMHKVKEFVHDIFRLFFFYGTTVILTTLQNVIGCALCSFQLVLIFMYPGVLEPKPKAKTKKSVKKD